MIQISFSYYIFPFQSSQTLIPRGEVFALLTVSNMKSKLGTNVR